MKEIQNKQITIKTPQTEKYHIKKKRISIWAPQQSMKDWKTTDLQTQKIRTSKSHNRILSQQFTFAALPSYPCQTPHNDQHQRIFNKQNNPFSKNLVPEGTEKVSISKDVTDHREIICETKDPCRSNNLKLNKKSSVNDLHKISHQRFGSTGQFVKTFDVSMKPLKFQNTARLSKQFEFIAKDLPEHIMKVQILRQEMHSNDGGSTRSTIASDHEKNVKLGLEHI
ncbi:unnamed protein product [Blepharisma stoltei]|uniref:Uncharacterized protein n=1 Tax=Blepharisma stoltei TaxID=1481888 RepID=A0AAU9JLQ7_9CILI|nr:unnamed protein product [Blepharisma stoltei]